MSRRFSDIVRGAAPIAVALAEPAAGPAVWLEDLKLFATGWVGGLIFFGTLLS